MYIPLLSFTQQHDSGGKRTPKLDASSSVTRFSGFIDDSDVDGETEVELSAEQTTVTTEQRPPSAGGITSESSADLQLRSLLRDEFILGLVYLVFLFSTFFFTRKYYDE